MPAETTAARKLAITVFLMVVAWEAENTPASLSGLGSDFFLLRRLHHALDYSASQFHAKIFCR
jgi:hypothetical protein